ncbi:MAG: trigger factor [Phycisphaerae bacterium]|nr:trigger factor [Phycisphaerae bacterium]
MAEEDAQSQAMSEHLEDENLAPQDGEEALAGEESEGESKLDLKDQLKEVIEVQVEDAGTLRKKLTVTIPRATIDEQSDEQYGELRREALVPGFRKGRAPRRLLEKRFGGEVKETLVQQLVLNGYMAATEKSDIKVLGDPLVWATEKGAQTPTLVEPQKAIELISIPDDGPLTFSCEVEVRPEFELPELGGIPVTKRSFDIKDDDVSTEVDRLRKMCGAYDTVEGPVQADDVVVADLKMTCEGAVLKEQAEVRMAARAQMVDGVVLEKLGEALAGAKADDVRSISGQIPDSYVKAEYRGKQADFEFKVRQIQRLSVPSMEDVVQRLGFETESEIREYVRKDMESRVGEMVRNDMGAQVYQYLLDQTSFDLPGGLSERQVNQVVMRRMLELYSQGVPQDEVQKQLDEMKTKVREDVVRELKLAFIMEKVAEQCEVEVSEGEINAQIAAIAQRQNQRFDRVRDQLAREGAITNLYVRIRDHKIVEQLIEKAKVAEEKPEAGDVQASDAT